MKYIIQRSITSVMAAALSVCALAACSYEADVVDEVIPTDTSVTTTSTAVSTTTTATTESTTVDTTPVPETTTQPAVTEPHIDETLPATESEQEPIEAPPSDEALANTDIQHSDGTYTQNLGKGTCTVPSFVTENSVNWTFDFFESQHCQSNPSKIPYSEITLENAHEAFPFLGWIGYSPDYIEIMPGDDEYTIAKKVCWNLLGSSADDYFMTWSDPRNCPTHCFKSQAEYDQFLADLQARLDANAEADQKIKEEHESGNRDFGFDETDEEIRDIFSGHR